MRPVAALFIIAAVVGLTAASPDAASTAYVPPAKTDYKPSVKTTDYVPPTKNDYSPAPAPSVSYAQYSDDYTPSYGRYNSGAAYGGGYKPHTHSYNDNSYGRGYNYDDDNAYSAPRPHSNSYSRLERRQTLPTSRAPPPPADAVFTSSTWNGYWVWQNNQWVWKWVWTNSAPPNWVSSSMSNAF